MSSRSVVPADRATNVELVTHVATTLAAPGARRCSHSQFHPTSAACRRPRPREGLPRAARGLPAPDDQRLRGSATCCRSVVLKPNPEMT